MSLFPTPYREPRRQPLARSRLPGLFVTGTDTGVGKTMVAGAIAQYFAKRDLRVAVSKPVATGCARAREGLVSEDAEFLAFCAQSRHPLDLICPVRYAEPLAPAVAAERAREPVDFDAISRSLHLMSDDSDVLIVEGAGGILVPLDTHTLYLHLARELGLPAVVVARPGLGTINHTLLTISALRQANVLVAGVVINRYPAEDADVATETNPDAIERWGGVSVLCVVPETQTRGGVPPDVAEAIATMDWEGVAQMR